MKKTFYLMAVALIIASCGDSKKGGEESNTHSNGTEAGAAASGNEAPTATPEVPPSAIENPKTASDPVAENGDMPVLSFEAETYEFPQSIMEGQSVTHNFRFTNTGKADLIITDAKAPCGCTIPSFSKDPVKPGETGQIAVRYESEGRGGGLHEKAITVTSNSIPNPRILRIKVNVNPKTQ